MKISKGNLIIYIIAGAISLICIGLFFIDKNNSWCIVSCSIGASGIGAVILALTLEISNNKVKEVQDIEKERSRILKYAQNLQFYINQYIYYFNALSLRMNDRNEVDTNEMIDPNFRNLTDMYLSSMLITDLNVSVLKRFYEYEHLLRDTLNTIHREVEFRFYSNFERDIADFVKVSFENNVEYYLTNFAVQRLTDGKQIKDMVFEIIEKEGKQVIVDFNEGKYYSNAITPYIIFYLMLEQEKVILTRIKKDFQEIAKENKATIK